MNTVIKNEFEHYLIQQGCSQYTPSGKSSTVYDIEKELLPSAIEKE
ncbi:hypothetical protein FACS1894211_10040 [Clostridia bacterium]|nr:hypothetical protein FACS1894211_10040 [Clostridia bacterium]